MLPPQPQSKKGSRGDDDDEEEFDLEKEAEKGIHVRVPTFLGSVENVFELDQFHKYYGDDDDE